MLKRSIDLILAGLMLTVALPVLIVTAILIKIDSPGPIIFRQTRMGRNFVPFCLLKLRTMKQGSAGPAYTLGADSRLTRIGGWVRWLKVDELLQLWNVLSGDMSLVGPRPVIPQLAEEFKQHYAGLLKVRPGLTDPATVKYCREAAILSLVPDPLKYFKTVMIPDKLRLSGEYIDHATLWSDMRILVDTVAALSSSSRAGRTVRLYGTADAAMTPEYPEQGE